MAPLGPIKPRQVNQEADNPHTLKKYFKNRTHIHQQKITVPNLHHTRYFHYMWYGHFIIERSSLLTLVTTSVARIIMTKMHVNYYDSFLADSMLS